MSFIFLILILALIFSALIFSAVMLVRNEKVYRYRTQLANRSYSVCQSYLMSIPSGEFSEENKKYHDKLRNIWYSIMDISYDRMVWMFWVPLKDERWLTKEQIDFLNLN